MAVAAMQAKIKLRMNAPPNPTVRPSAKIINRWLTKNNTDAARVRRSPCRRFAGQCVPERGAVGGAWRARPRACDLGGRDHADFREFRQLSHSLVRHARDCRAGAPLP